MLRKSVLLTVLPVCLGLSACGDANTSPDTSNHIGSEIAGASFSLYDGAHGGSDRFYFLPPLVSNPKIGPANDEAIYPALTVTVCALNGTACAAGDSIVRYLPSGGSHGPGIELLGNHYEVTWPSGDFPVDASTDYRITVAASDVELGHVDVDLLNKQNGSAKSGFVGLVNGKQLLVPFRIRSGVIKSLAITPADTTINVGQAVQFSYTAVDYSDQPATGRAATWASSDPSVATIDQNGNLTAVGAGTTTITLTVEGHVVNATVTVASGANSFTVSPTSAMLTLGQSATTSLAITAIGPEGPITSGLNPTWILDENQSGITVTPSAAGFTAVIAPTKVGVWHVDVSLAGLPPQRVTVSVNPAPAPAITLGQNANFAQVPLDAQAILGVPVPAGATYSYSSSDPTVAQVDPVTGVVTPRGDGSATVTLTVTDANGQIIGTQVIAVAAPQDGCVTSAISASNILRPLGTHIIHIFAPGEQLTTTVTNLPSGAHDVTWALGAQNAPVSLTPNGTNATITAGKFAGNVTLNTSAILTDNSSTVHGVGCLYVTGETGGGSGVPVAGPSRIVITQPAQSLAITDQGSGTLALHATVLDQNGQPMDASAFSFTWASGSPEAVTIAPSHTADAVIEAQGASTTAVSITVSISGTNVNGTFTVTSVVDERPAAPPVTLAITPGTATCTLGGGKAVTLTASASVAGDVSWTTSGDLYFPAGSPTQYQITGNTIQVACQHTGRTITAPYTQHVDASVAGVSTDIVITIFPAPAP